MSCESEIDPAEVRFRLQALKFAPWHAVSARELADMLGVTLQVLANWRVRGAGPMPCASSDYPGNRTFYRVSAIECWLANLSGRPQQEWEKVAEWLMKTYIFPNPLNCEERTRRVVNQLCRWNLYPAKHKAKTATLYWGIPSREEAAKIRVSPQASPVAEAKS